MEQKELQKILDTHELWLKGGGGERANLSDADLQCAYLRGAYLSDAYLSRADLSGANLQCANLSGANLLCADLRGANLSCANFTDANLYDANLSGANLSGANLPGADLMRANLMGANLIYANLRGVSLNGANLRGANLRGANLKGANLSGANLQCADLRGANLEQVQYDESTTFFALQCPEEGSFVGWKKCENNVLVKLLIPAEAKRSSGTSRKCRASKATVLEIIGAEKGISQNNSKFVYEVGKEMIPDSFDDDRWNECSHGIHFFITRKEAEDY